MAVVPGIIESSLIQEDERVYEVIDGVYSRVMVYELIKAASITTDGGQNDELLMKGGHKKDQGGN